jgi:tryptophan halogenase
MNQRSVMDIVVLGGGTAGWLTALYAKIVMPTKRITVIESDEIGILGAGEGATPHLITLLDILDIPVSHFIKETGATIKNSIKFTNWNNEGSQDYYHHSFNVYGNVAWSFYNQNVNYVQSSPSSYVAGCALGQRLPEYDLNSKLAKYNKVPFLFDERRQDVSNPIIQFEPISSFSIHFDAIKVASFLKATFPNRPVRIAIIFSLPLFPSLLQPVSAVYMFHVAHNQPGESRQPEKSLQCHRLLHFLFYSLS